MKERGISQLPVLKDGTLWGVVSEVKVLNALVQGKATMVTPVGELADSNDVATVRTDTSLSTLTDHLAQGKSAVVLDGSRVIGVLTKIDLIAHLAQSKQLGANLH